MTTHLRRRRIYTTVATLALITGAALFAPLAWMNLQNNQAVQASAGAQPSEALSLVQTPDVVQGVPVRVQVDSARINLPVITGSYNQKTGQWTLTNTSAQYADRSLPANNKAGTTLIYAHAEQNLFGRLSQLSPNSTAYVYTDNGYKFTYTLTTTEAVSPRQTSVITSEGAPQLLLQTCSGTFSQNRQLYYFKLQSYQKL